MKSNEVALVGSPILRKHASTKKYTVEIISRVMNFNISSAFGVLGLCLNSTLEKRNKPSGRHKNTARHIIINEFKRILKVAWLSLTLLIFVFPLPVLVAVDFLVNLDQIFSEFNNASLKLWSLIWCLIKLSTYLYLLFNNLKCSLLLKAIQKFQKKYKWTSEKYALFISVIAVCLPLYRTGNDETLFIISSSFHNFIESFVCLLFYVYSTGFSRIITKYCDTLRYATETRKVQFFSLSLHNDKKRQLEKIHSKDLCELFYELEKTLLQIDDIRYCLMNVLSLPITLILMNCLTSITMSLYHIINELLNNNEDIHVDLLLQFVLQLWYVLMLTSPPDAINNAVSNLYYLVRE